MAKQFNQLASAHIEFIQKQKIFFVATAMTQGKINLSPKGMDSLRVHNDHTVIWLNLTGSGNETAAHLLENNRMTIMFCAFEGKPLILRLYGSAITYHARDEQFQKYVKEFPKDVGARQIFEMNIDMVQTSCGSAVPFMNYDKDRDVLAKWASHKGAEGIKAYWEVKNTVSLEGFETKILGK